VLESLTDIKKTIHNREKIRANIARWAEDPTMIEKFRAILAEDETSAQTLSDDEVAAHLRDMSSKRFLLTSPEEVAKKRTLLTNWDQQVTLLLPDAVFDEWRLRRSRV